MTKPPIIKSMTRRYVTVLCILAALLITNYFTFYLVIADQESAAAIINISGRQRMLSQRVAMHVDHIANAISSERALHRKMLLESVSQMERSHQALINGDEGMKLPGSISPELHAMYFEPPFEVDKKIRSFLADAKSMAGTTEETIDTHDPRVKRIRQAALGPLLKSIDAVVLQHQLESESRIKLLDLVTVIDLAFSFFVLAISAFGVFRPLTRRMGEEIEKLESAESHIRAIVDNTVDGIVTIDERGIAESFNPAAERIFGYSQEEVIGRNISILMPEPHSGSQNNYLSSYFNTDEAKDIGVGCDVEGQRKDGSTFPMHVAVSEARIEGRRMFVSILRDVTERKMDEDQLEMYQNELERKVTERTQNLSNEIARRQRTETALRESQQRLQAITGSLFEGVLVVDVNGHIVFANRSAETLLGRQGDGKLAGRDIDDVFLLKQGVEDIHFSDSPFIRVAEDSNIVRDDSAVFITNDGDALQVAFACSPLIENDKSCGVIISFRDISALKDAQNEALQASKLASVGQLAAGIAHEINTPTQYIGDNLRFLGDAHGDIATVLESYRKLTLAAHEAGVLGDHVAETAAAAEEADLEYLLEEIPAATKQSLGGIEQVTRIVLAMKEFAHPGSKDKTATDLNRAIENTLMVCRNEWKHVAEVDVQLDSTLPPVSCLPDELNQVFLNLIINAAHAIEETETGGKGRITIATHVNEGWADIRVTDTGGGIPDKIRGSIFDPFFTTKKVGKGTGQGLSICRDVVVKKHGGKIFFESEPGEGTTFVVRLPINGQTAISEGA